MLLTNILLMLCFIGNGICVLGILYNSRATRGLPSLLELLQVWWVKVMKGDGHNLKAVLIFIILYILILLVL